MLGSCCSTKTEKEKAPEIKLEETVVAPKKKIKTPKAK
jgi:hypothetical protein